MKTIKQMILALVCISCILLFNQCRKNTVVDEFAYKINKQCPVKIDSYTTLINAVVIKDSLIFNYRTDYPAEFFNDQKFLELSREGDLHNIVLNPDMKPLTKVNVSFIYRYRSREDKLLIEIKYTPNDYLHFQPDKKDDIYSYLVQMANRDKGILPIFISDNTYVIEVKAEKPAILEYTIQIANADITEGEINIHKSALVNRIKGQGSLSRLRDHGVVFRYIIVDKNRIIMNKLEVTPEEYK